MKTTKECPSCGAQNDIIFTNCIFCKTSLPQTDLNALSNDDLVMKASEWVAKTADSFLIVDNPNAKGLDKALGGQKYMQRPELIGNAEKYINLLAVRSTSNPTLSVVYHDLKAKLDKNRKRISSTSKILIGVIVFITLMIIFFSNMINSHDKGIEKEKERLETLVTQINTAISNKDYNAAEIFCAQLKWEYFDDYSSDDTKELQKTWDQKRVEMINTIRNLKNK
jgi:hypothetical protein